MKKILIALTVASSMSAAHAVPAMARAHPTPAHNYNYNIAYNHGKNDAYHNVATTLFVVGAVAIAGVIVYRLGEESRWTANEKGIVYKF